MAGVCVSVSVSVSVSVCVCLRVCVRGQGPAEERMTRGDLCTSVTSVTVGNLSITLK